MQTGFGIQDVSIHSGLLSSPSALVHFQHFHPLDFEDKDQEEAPVIVGFIESEGLLKVSLHKLTEGMKDASGELRHYLSGLIYSYFAVRTYMAGLSHSTDAQKDSFERAQIVRELTFLCRKKMGALDNESYRPELAMHFGMLETAACLLMHISPAHGQEFIDCLYL